MSNIYSMTDLWNDAAVVFTAIKMNVTNTASAAASKLLDIQIGGVSKFMVGLTGLIPTPAVATTLASAATIAPVNPIHFVSGTVAVNTITAPPLISATGGHLTLIPTGAFTWTAAGNIAVAGTAVVGQAIVFSYDATTTKWYPSIAAGAAIAPTLVNSWANLGSGTQAAGYWKDADGIVHLHGLVTGGTIPNTICNLPVGYRPAANQTFAISSNSAFGSLQVTSGGDVNPIVGNTAWVSLCGITFQAA